MRWMRTVSMMRMWMMPRLVVRATWSGSATTQLMEEKISLNRGSTASLDTWPGGQVVSGEQVVAGWPVVSRWRVVVR